MTSRLLLVSHGSTKAVREVAFAQDEPLDARGEAREQMLASSIRRVDAAWTGPDADLIEIVGAK